jgi:hypothetical protein
MQDHLHCMQDLQLVDFGFYGIVSVSLQLVRMKFRYTPLLGRTFLPLRSVVLTAVGAMLPPTPPSIGIRHHSKKNNN